MEEELLQFAINETQLDEANGKEQEEQGQTIPSIRFSRRRPPPTFQGAFSQARLHPPPNHTPIHQAFNPNSRSETLLNTFIKPIHPSASPNKQSVNTQHPAHPTSPTTTTTTTTTQTHYVPAPAHPATADPSTAPASTKHSSNPDPDDFQDAAIRFLASFVTSQSDSPPSSSELPPFPSTQPLPPIHPASQLGHHLHLVSQPSLGHPIDDHPLQLLAPSNRSPSPPTQFPISPNAPQTPNTEPVASSLGFSSASPASEPYQAPSLSPGLPAQPPSPTAWRPPADPTPFNHHSSHSATSNNPDTLQLPPRPPPIKLCLPPRPRQLAIDADHIPTSHPSSGGSTPTTSTTSSYNADKNLSKRPLHPSSSRDSRAKRVKLPPQIFIKTHANQQKRREMPAIQPCSGTAPNMSNTPSKTTVNNSFKQNPNAMNGLKSSGNGIEVDQIQIWKKIQLLRSQRLTSLSKNSSIAEFHLDRLEKQWIETLRQAGTLSSAVELKDQVENYQDLIKKLQDLLGEELVRVQIEESILRHVRGIIADRLVQIQDWNQN